MTDAVTQRSPRVGRLDRAEDVRSELSRVYRAARRGEITSQDGSRLASILDTLRRCLETSDLEQRISELEKR